MAISMGEWLEVATAADSARFSVRAHVRTRSCSALARWHGLGAKRVSFESAGEWIGGPNGGTCHGVAIDGVVDWCVTRRHGVVLRRVRPLVFHCLCRGDLYAYGRNLYICDGQPGPGLLDDAGRSIGTGHGHITVRTSIDVVEHALR